MKVKKKVTKMKTMKGGPVINVLANKTHILKSRLPLL